jgi:TolB-like protein/tetratricopeptide (TPR) repeat protein
VTNRAESSNVPATKRGLIAELSRRHVWRAAVLYIGAVWALAQGIAQLGPFFDAPDWVVRWFVIACAIGFPFWIAFAWFFAWTPQGFKREENVERNPTLTRATGRKLDFWIIGVLVVAVVLLITNQFVLHRDATSVANKAEAKTLAATLAKVPEQSVAVLPFADESTDKDQQYFSDGLSENLIIALSQFKGLKVISRDSSFQFRGSKDSAAQIGSALGVRHLLEGSVRRLGDEVRISAMLVNAADGSTLWSHHYDRPYKDLFKLQDDITMAVTTALKTRLLASSEAAKQTDRPPSGNLAAYNAVLQGNFYTSRNTLAAMQTAARYYEQAAQLDPDYAYAWAELAEARNTLVSYFLSGNERGDLMRGARAAANKALALAPDLVVAHLAQSDILFNFDWNLEGAERELQRATQLSPSNASVLTALAAIHAYRGHFTNAIATLRRVVALNPLSAGAEANLGTYLTSAGHLAAAQQALQKAIGMQPQAATYRAKLAIAQILNGDPAAALATARQETDPFWRTWALALAYWANGQHDKSNAELKQLIDKDSDDAGSQIATVYAQRGQSNQAFHWLDHAVATRDVGALQMLTDPFLARYKNDPRYATLARKLGLIGDDSSVPASADSAATPASATSTP